MGTMTVKVSVDRALTTEELLELAGRSGWRVFGSRENLMAGDKLSTVVEEVEVTLFFVGNHSSQREIEAEYRRYGLTPLKPQVFLALNRGAPDSSFAGEHENATYWKSGGKTHAMSFGEYYLFGSGDYIPRLEVCVNETLWGGGIWFAGTKDK